MTLFNENLQVLITQRLPHPLAGVDATLLREAGAALQHSDNLSYPCLCDKINERVLCDRCIKRTKGYRKRSLKLRWHYFQMNKTALRGLTVIGKFAPMAKEMQCHVQSRSSGHEQVPDAGVSAHPVMGRRQSKWRRPVRFRHLLTLSHPHPITTTEHSTEIWDP